LVAQYPVPAILVTGLASPQIREQATQLGVVAVLEEPIDYEKLAGFVDLAIRTSRQVRSVAPA
jgi:AmiR/NasT family two-component response regulator